MVQKVQPSTAHCTTFRAPKPKITAFMIPLTGLLLVKCIVFCFVTKMDELGLAKSVGKFRYLMALQISVFVISVCYLNWRLLSVASQ